MSNMNVLLTGDTRNNHMMHSQSPHQHLHSHMSHESMHMQQQVQFDPNSQHPPTLGHVGIPPVSTDRQYDLPATPDVLMLGQGGGVNALLPPEIQNAVAGMHSQPNELLQHISVILEQKLTEFRKDNEEKEVKRQRIKQLETTPPSKMTPEQKEEYHIRRKIVYSSVISSEVFQPLWKDPQTEEMQFQDAVRHAKDYIPKFALQLSTREDLGWSAKFIEQIINSIVSEKRRYVRLGGAKGKRSRKEQRKRDMEEAELNPTKAQKALEVFFEMPYGRIHVSGLKDVMCQRFNLHPHNLEGKTKVELAVQFAQLLLTQGTLQQRTAGLVAMTQDAPFELVGERGHLPPPPPTMKRRRSGVDDDFDEDRLVSSPYDINHNKWHDGDNGGSGGGFVGASFPLPPFGVFSGGSGHDNPAHLGLVGATDGHHQQHSHHLPLHNYGRSGYPYLTTTTTTTGASLPPPPPPPSSSPLLTLDGLPPPSTSPHHATTTATQQQHNTTHAQEEDKPTTNNHCEAHKPRVEEFHRLPPPPNTTTTHHDKQEDEGSEEEVGSNSILTGRQLHLAQQQHQQSQQHHQHHHQHHQHHQQHPNTSSPPHCGDDAPSGICNKLDIMNNCQINRPTSTPHPPTQLNGPALFPLPPQ